VGVLDNVFRDRPKQAFADIRPAVRTDDDERDPLRIGRVHDLLPRAADGHPDDHLHTLLLECPADIDDLMLDLLPQSSLGFGLLIRYGPEESPSPRGDQRDIFPVDDMNEDYLLRPCPTERRDIVQHLHGRI